MLAYLDNVLDPADAELLGKKIDESDYATKLVHHIRTVTKKVRMNAPKLDGKGTGNDPNTVAEYLDSALPQERVNDFEQICLQSDAHLAEVACSHQILTLVLGKAANVPLELRDRVYALGSSEKHVAAAQPLAASAPPATTAVAQPAEESTASQVPDYLRAGQKRSIWPVVGVALAAVLLLGVALRMMGPFDGSHPLARPFGRRFLPAPR
jgi:hypothetical protein